MVDLMMFITISGETELDSKLRARMDLFDWEMHKLYFKHNILLALALIFTSRQLQSKLQIGSVRLQLAAENDSTFEFSAND